MKSFIIIPYALILVLMVVSSMYAALHLTFCHGLGDYYNFTFGNFMIAATTIILNVIFVAIMRLGVPGMLVSNIIANVFSGTYLMIKKRAYTYMDFNTSCFSVAKKMMLYSLPLVPDAISWWTITAIDRVIINSVLGISAIGIISVSSKFSNAFSQLYEVFNNSWTENISTHMNDSDIEDYISDVIHDVLVISVSLATCVNLVLIYAYDLFVNTKFSNGFVLIPIFMIAALFNIGRKAYNAIFIALKSTKIIAKITVLTALIDIVANVFLVKYIGIYAAPISSIIAYALVYIMSIYLVRKSFRLNVIRCDLVISIIIFIMSIITYIWLSNKPFVLIFVIIELALCVCMNRKYLIRFVGIILEKIDRYRGL